MRKYRITWYENGVKRTKIVEARNRREAFQLAYELTDSEDIFITEVKE